MKRLLLLCLLAAPALADDSKGQQESCAMAVALTEQQRNEQANLARNLAVQVAQLQKRITELEKPEPKK